MYKSASTEYCHCKKKSGQNTSNLHVKFQCDRNIIDRYKTVSTQTDSDADFKAQEQIAELLSEIAVTLNQKSKLELELAQLQNTIKKNEENFNEVKMKSDEEIARLINNNRSKDAIITNLKITHLEEQKALLAQMNELKTEINVLKSEKEQFCHDVSSERLALEQKLNVALTDLKSETEKNDGYQIKITKYKNKLKFLAKYTKHLIEALNSYNIKNEQMNTKSRSSIMTNAKKSISNENIETNNSYMTTQNEIKHQQPDIENMILAELFFKPNPVPIDVASFFFCSEGNSNHNNKIGDI